MTAFARADDDGPPATAADHPASIDVLAHLRRLRHQVVPALLLAMVVGVATLLLAQRQEPVYEATISGFVDTAAPAGSAAEGAIRSEWAQAGVDMAMDADVLDEALAPSGLDWSTAKASDHITVARDPDSLALLVRVLGPTPEVASEVAEEMLVVIGERLTQRQQRTVADLVGDLQAQATATQRQLAALPAGSPVRQGLEQDRDSVLAQIAAVRQDAPAATLTALGAATASGTAVAPKPVEKATTVAVVAFLVTAEALVFLRRPRRRAAGRTGDGPHRSAPRLEARR